MYACTQACVSVCVSVSVCVCVCVCVCVMVCMSANLYVSIYIREHVDEIHSSRLPPFFGPVVRDSLAISATSSNLAYMRTQSRTCVFSHAQARVMLMCC
jgi:hypothetical protein